MPNAGAKKFPFHLLLQSEQGKMAGNGAGQQKKQQIFFRLTAFTGRVGGGWYSVLKVRAGWLDNLGFVLTVFFGIYLRYYNCKNNHYCNYPKSNTQNKIIVIKAAV